MRGLRGGCARDNVDVMASGWLALCIPIGLYLGFSLVLVNSCMERRK